MASTLGSGDYVYEPIEAVDSRGDVGEVSWTNWRQTFKDKSRPHDLRSLHKFRKVE